MPIDQSQIQPTYKLKLNDLVFLFDHHFDRQGKIDRNNSTAVDRSLFCTSKPHEVCGLMAKVILDMAHEPRTFEFWVVTYSCVKIVLILWFFKDAIKNIWSQNVMKRFIAPMLWYIFFISYSKKKLADRSCHLGSRPISRCGFAFNQQKQPAWNLFDHDPICQFLFHTKQLARCKILSLKYEVMMIQTRWLSQTLSSKLIMYFHYYSLDSRKCKYNFRNNYYCGSRTAYSIVQQMILYYFYYYLAVANALHASVLFTLFNSYIVLIGMHEWCACAHFIFIYFVIKIVPAWYRPCRVAWYVRKTKKASQLARFSNVIFC